MIRIVESRNVAASFFRNVLILVLLASEEVDVDYDFYYCV